MKQNAAPRAAELFREYFDANSRRTSRVFAALMVGQWLFAILVAALWSPYGWEGKTQSVHVHVYAAVLLGGLLSSLPLMLAIKRPAATETRYVVAVAQMLWSALLIHLSGGRIETHFHVFGSLAFVAFYRDWKILIPATVVVAGDHLLRGIFWPESVYGTPNPEWWRFLEHAFWVVFEDGVLVLACVRGVEELKSLAGQRAEAEASHEALTRAEKLAAVGQLAASVGHELRNPLGAVRNGLAYVSKRVSGPPEQLAADKRVASFLKLMDRELGQCSRIIGSLLDFARERAPERRPCPLRPLVEEAIVLVPQRAGVTVSNEVPDTLPIPDLDKDQFRQVVANLVQNGIEAIPSGRTGQVTITGGGGAGEPFAIKVSDDGGGIEKGDLERIFQPLYTTKTKGTGLGLAIVYGLVRKHGGDIRVDSVPGRGTTFSIQVPTS